MTSSAQNQPHAVSASNGTAASSSSSSLLSDMPTAPMSTLALQNKLRLLRQESQKDSQLLTQKLASSQSGQNLLHIGTSLSTLPPDLHSLLTQLHPILSAAEGSEQEQLQTLRELVQAAKEIRLVERRIQHAAECADLYADLVAAEHSLQQRKQQNHHHHHQQQQQHSSYRTNRQVEFERMENDLANEDDEEDHEFDQDDEHAAAASQLDYALSLERAAHITLCLVRDLQSATETVSTLTTTTTAAGTNSNHGSTMESPTKRLSSSDDGSGTAGSASSSALPTLHTGLPQDTERAQFLMKLAPRIRRVEAETARSLGHELDRVLQAIQKRRDADRRRQQDETAAEVNGGGGSGDNNDDETGMASQDDLLLMLGHCMRGLALLGRGREVESIFARVAIMPLIRSEVSMGRLDEGGARGECAGLFSLLDTMAESIYQTFGPVLRLSEAMFDFSRSTSENGDMDVDLLTAGVWVPIATALMADAGIKMAIFSPGIASILQANYCALDAFLSELAARVLKTEDDYGATCAIQSSENSHHLMFHPTISEERIKNAQDRIYSHQKTAEFSKKWNLPIYYQLRFGDSCTRLNKAIEQTQREGWIADVFHGPPEQAEQLKQQVGFELTLFLELYEILLNLWRPDVILRPLSNRFLRGAIQLVGRIVFFVSSGMEGSIKFEEEKPALNGGAVENGVDGATASAPSPPSSFPTRAPYCWGDSEEDVAAVAWEMTILDSALRHDYVDTVCKALRGGDDKEADFDEVRIIVSDVLKEAADQIHPIIDTAWNDAIVNILTNKCSAPLAAVKGVAATYRMTNRPPPTQASPFVSTILRPLSDFINEFRDRMPDRVGSRWKQKIVVTIADRYAAAVDELIATVQRTEVALNSRRARRTTAGGMRDGEKVKLQLYLDYHAFAQSVSSVGVEPTTVIGLSKLRELTLEGETLLNRKDGDGN